MFCDKCKLNIATFHQTLNINGEQYETHLCSTCANESGVSNLFSLNNIDVFDIPFFNDDFMLEESKKCETCKSTFSDFLKRGKLGCKNCYETFQEEIRDMLENMESPIDFNIDDYIDNEENEALSKLQAEFQKAIEEERYEDAGKLKNEIKKLQENKENGNV